MAQATDYNLANQSGASFRAELNTILAAVVSQNSGSTAPTTTYAYQLWIDTGESPNPLLKLRNGANSAWITIGDVTVANLGLALLASPTFTGTVTIPTATITTGVGIPLGTVSSPTIYFTGDTNTGIYSPAANQLSFATDGTERLRLDDSGQIEAVSLGTAAAPTYTFNTDSNTGLYSPGADQVAISTNGTGRLFVRSDGNIGIGAQAAGSLLDLRSASAPSLHISTTGYTPDYRGYSIDFSEAQRTGGINFTNSSPSAFLDLYAGGSVANTGGWQGQIRFFTGGTNGYGTERMRLDSSGRLGLGTSSPSHLLQVNGSACIAGTADNIFFGIDDNTSPRLGLVKKAGGGPFFGAGSSTSFVFSHSSGTDIANPSSQTYSERARIDSSGRLLVGTSSAYGTATIIEGHSSTQFGPQMLLRSTRNDSFGPYFIGQKIRSSSIVQSGDTVCTLVGEAFDGSAYIVAARIEAVVDGTPGTNDMPGRLVFSVTLDGASSPTEAFRITNDRVRAYNQAAPAAVNATATLTVANLKTGIITSTSAAATDMTLPTGTDTEGGFSGIYTNMTFEWSVINTGPSLVTVLANTAHTLVGSGAVATGTSARFASRRSGTNTFVTYRLS